jgi:beta-galactosidase
MVPVSERGRNRLWVSVATMANRRACAYVFERLEGRYLLNVGDPYSVPTNPRVAQDLAPTWKFALNPSGTPQSTSYDDSSWSRVNLPYTWDGALTGSPPSGTGWYRKTITVDPSLIGKELYLEFGGAYQVTSLYIDGTQVNYVPGSAGSTHNGGFGEFNFDATSQLTAGSHLIAVSVNNNTNANISPAGAGDYTKQGGLYRDVSLVAISQASHVAQIESAPGTSTPVATPGVYFSNSSVTIGIASANIQVQSILDNLSASSSSVNVTSYLVDANGIIQSQTTTAASLTAGQKSVSVSQSSTVANPHLWDGRIDPYLYTLYVEVRDSSTNALLDLSQQQVGIRSFKINAQPIPSDPNLANQDQAAFELDGLPYTLVGVNIHQDSGVPGQLGATEGNAQTAADIQQQIDLVSQVGATFVRTAHYEHSQALYNDADKAGLILEVDGDLQGTITSTSMTSAFVENYEDQLTENVKQNFNHPSIIVYSMYNEIGNSSANATLISNLSTFVHSLDSTRYTTADSNDGSSTNGIDKATDLLGTHLYGGWYTGGLTSDGSSLDSMHSANPTLPLAVTEYGAGASANQYTTAIQLPPPNTTDHFHPENAQTQLEELAYSQFASRNYLWGIALWNMFDFSVSSRNEGDTQGQNDKGLITRDRQTKKDSFYFYQANWNVPTRSWANTPVLYISDHTWTDRATASNPITVFSNLGAPTLYLNNVSQGTMVPLVISGLTIPNAYTTASGNITLASGANNVVVQQVFNNQLYSNAVVWNYHPAAISGSASARVQFTDSTADLQSGYAADTGGAFNSTYGWVNTSTQVPTANTAGTYNRTSITTGNFSQIYNRTGIMLPSNLEWEYALPNGVYDVHVVSADSTNPAMVNNLNLSGTLLHDLNYTTHYGNNSYFEFYTTVDVTNGLLTLSAGAGYWAPRVSHIDINFVGALPPTVTSAVSHKLQGSTNFDLNLPLSGSPTIEPRVGGPTQIILTFGHTLDTTAPLNLTLSSGTGSASYLGNNQISIGMSGATDGQVLTILLTGPQVVSGAPGNYTLNVGVLLGDIDGSGSVNVGDVIAAKLNSGVPLTSSNFLSDLNGDGAINVADVITAKLNSGHTLLEASGQSAFSTYAQSTASGASLIRQSLAQSVSTTSSASPSFHSDNPILTNAMQFHAVNLTSEAPQSSGPSLPRPVTQQRAVPSSLGGGQPVATAELLRDLIFRSDITNLHQSNSTPSNRNRTMDADFFDTLLADLRSSLFAHFR